MFTVGTVTSCQTGMRQKGFKNSNGCRSRHEQSATELMILCWLNSVLGPPRQGRSGFVFSETQKQCLPPSPHPFRCIWSEHPRGGTISAPSWLAGWHTWIPGPQRRTWVFDPLHVTWVVVCCCFLTPPSLCLCGSRGWQPLVPTTTCLQPSAWTQQKYSGAQCQVTHINHV